MKKGFTLIELLVVMAILAILSGLILGVMASVQKGSKIRLTEARFQLLKSALDRYEHDFDDYPPSLGDDGIKGGISLYECLITEKKGGPYIKLSDIPSGDAGHGDMAFLDTWNKPIYYLHHRDYRNQPPNKREYRLLSSGPNMIFDGGSKEGDDVVNWNKDKADLQ